MIRRALANPAQRRYLARFTVAMSCYVVAILGVSWLFRHHPPAGLLAYALAVLPALPILAVLVIIGLYLLEERDEFQRTVVTQTQLWAIGGTLAVTTFWGFLERFTPVQHLPAYSVAVIFWICNAIALPLVRWRYR